MLAVLEVLLQTGLEIPADDEVIETLLAASKYGPLARQRRILLRVKPLLKVSVSDHLQAEAIHQQSVISRLEGDITNSNRLLQEFLDHSEMATRLESRHILGLLHLSRAANYAYLFDFVSADKELKMWSPPTNITEKILDVVWSQIHAAAGISRGQGHFEVARTFYESCLKQQPLSESKRYLALSHLADTYVEVDHLQQSTPQYTEDLLVKAETLIRPIVERLRLHAPRSKGFRRLLLSLSEIEIRRNRFDAAKHLLQEVSNIYATLVEPDIVDRLGHVRAFIALARIAPFSEAESCWMNALNLGRRYNPDEEEVFIVALIFLFLCFTRLRNGDQEGGKAAFDYAAGICRTKPPQYLIPGAGTYLFDYTQHQIVSIAGWRLPTHE
jgi:tetratricopeptide (TPR) repeat protein